MNSNIILSLLILLFVSGCATNSKVVNKDKVYLPSASLPHWEVGDRVTYGNGRSEKVVKVDRNKVYWKKTKTTKFETSNNFIEPELHYESKTKIRDKKVISFGGSKHPDTLWPLKIDNSVSFYYNQDFTNLKIGRNFATKRMKQMKCRVDDTATVQVLAGKFDTYVVKCHKVTSKQNRGTEYIYYYASSLGHWVLKLTQTTKGKRYEKELMRLDRGVRWLSKEQRRSLRKVLQDTMENNLTSQKSIWKSKDKKTIVEIYPTRTIKLETGVFCRNYVQVIKSNNEARSAGLLCRNKDKKWRTPKREKVKNLEFKFF
jgi:surface antigen